MPLLNWKEARALIVHPATSGGLISNLTSPDSKLTPEQLKESLKETESLHIIPGIGSYSDKLWALVKDNPTIKRKIENGLLVVLTKGLLAVSKKPEEANDPASKLPDTLKDVTVQTAQDLVEGCMEVETLEKWLKSENEGQKRVTLTSAIAKQIKKIKDTDERFKGGDKKE